MIRSPGALRLPLLSVLMAVLAILAVLGESVSHTGRAEPGTTPLSVVSDHGGKAFTLPAAPQEQQVVEAGAAPPVAVGVPAAEVVGRSPGEPCRGHPGVRGPPCGFATVRFPTGPPSA